VLQRHNHADRRDKCDRKELLAHGAVLGTCRKGEPNGMNRLAVRYGDVSPLHFDRAGNVLSRGRMEMVQTVLRYGCEARDSYKQEDNE